MMERSDQSVTQGSRDDICERERYIAACHEAGHAMAACMRGVPITGLWLGPDGEAEIRIKNGSGTEYAFIAFAGPWAEVRAQWTKSCRNDDAVDDDGRCFADHLAVAFCHNQKDSLDYHREVEGDIRAAIDASAAAMFFPDEIPPRITPPGNWDAELEARWPEIQEWAATMLADAEV